jgi:transglutaminase/protease-like cytokinesis protein 3
VDMGIIDILSSSNTGTRFEYEEVADLLQVNLFFNIKTHTAVPDHISTVHRWTFHRKQWKDRQLCQLPSLMPRYFQNGLQYATFQEEKTSS